MKMGFRRQFFAFAVAIVLFLPLADGKALTNRCNASWLALKLASSNP